MTVTFQLPPEIARSVRDRFADLDTEAKEALLVDLHRREIISRGQLSAALGLSWYETEGVLKCHGVSLEYDAEDLEADRRTMAEFLSRKS